MKRNSEMYNKSNELFVNNANNKTFKTNNTEFDHISRKTQKLASSVFEEEKKRLNLISGFCSQIKSKKSLIEILNSFNSCVFNLGYEFTAICIPDNDNKNLVVKSFEKNRELSEVKFLLSDESNYLVSSYVDKVKKTANSKELYSINCPKNFEYQLVSLVYQEETAGLVVLGCEKNNRQNDEFANILCGYLALVLSNYKMQECISSFNSIDSLTGLYTHRKIQEKFTRTLEEAACVDKKVSILLFDIDNISGINREYGHSRGDDVITRFAGEINSHIRKKDMAGRYGGDEILVVMPETDNETAKNVAEDIIAAISNVEVADVGRLNSYVGVATYPTCATDQEKLLILAEQSMLISRDKGQEQGDSSVTSSNDIDFWNKTALDSLSKVISRRNLNEKFKFEDELVRQFQNEEKESKISLEIVTSLAAAIDAKDTYTRGHSQSVSSYSEALAKAIELDSHTVEQIKLGAILHDIGKIGISETILRKPGPLTDHEWEVMKQHPIIGVKKILEPIESLKELIPTVRHHHERIDGFGYPDRLKGEEIPIGAKIVAIADAFHALISHRPYRKAVSVRKALEILKSGAGKQWDKYLVEKFIMITPMFFLDMEQ